MRRVSPHHPTRCLGEYRNPRSKMDFMHIWGQKEAIWNTFSVFLIDVGPPNVAGPGKTFPSSPLSTGLRKRQIFSDTLTVYIHLRTYRCLRSPPSVFRRKSCVGRQSPRCKPSSVGRCYTTDSRMERVCRPDDRTSPSLHRTTTSLVQCSARSRGTARSSFPGRTCLHCTKWNKLVMLSQFRKRCVLGLYIWVPWKLSELPAWLRPRLLFPKILMGFCFDRPCECAYKIWSP